MLIFHFCSEIRDTCATFASGAKAQDLNTHGRDLNGGLILSMDLKQAYDRLPRPALAEGLSLSQCPRNLSAVLLQWLVGARYEITHRGRRTWIPTSRRGQAGVQGIP